MKMSGSQTKPRNEVFKGGFGLFWPGKLENVFNFLFAKFRNFFPAMTIHNSKKLSVRTGFTHNFNVQMAVFLIRPRAFLYRKGNNASHIFSCDINQLTLQ